MANINEQIDRILDMRLGRKEFEGKGHLQIVEGKISKLVKLRESVVALQSYKYSLDAKINDGPSDFYQTLSADQKVLSAYSQIDFADALKCLDSALEDLRKLQKRFEREAVRIAFIGYERQGKSTFLQSMTGLPNEVIPAYDGTSCTGAVSVIHNESGQGAYRAEIQFYTLPEFLNIVKTKLQNLFPERTYTLTCLDDLKNVDLSGYEGNNRNEIEELFRRGIIGHKDDYGRFLGQGRKTLDDKDEIMKFVAQYREYDNKEDVPNDARETDIRERPKETDNQGNVTRLVWRHMYYYYLAVKSIDIYCSFPNKNCGRVEFVDTVGLGPSINADAVEKEMFRVLLEDCDGAIDVYCPPATGGAITINESNIYEKLNKNLASRSPELWLSYAINAIYGPKGNTQNIEDIKNDLKNRTIPFGLYVDVNAKDEKEVNDKLLVPHLEMVARNLSLLDNNLIDVASGKHNSACDECRNLVNQALLVASVGAFGDWKFEQDGFNHMLHNFNIAMNTLDHDGYAKKKDLKCEDLMKEYKSLLDKIDMNLPSEEDLLDRFKSGTLLTTNAAFEEAIEEVRNGIFEVFENVNQTVLYPLQEKVKQDIIEVLYNAGMWSNLPLPGEKIAPSPQWLERIVDNYIPKDKYPSLYDAVRYVLDYRINIEGLVEYNVTNSLHIIERTHKEFIPYNGQNPQDYEGMASEVWQNLANRIVPIQERLESWIGDFSLIPSQSFYSRVHKFYVKIGTNKDGIREFKDFYDDNKGYIWRDDIQSKSSKNELFSKWNTCVEGIRKSLNEQ